MEILLEIEAECSCTFRAQSPPVSEANTLCEGTHQAKSVALHASFAKLYVIWTIFYETFTESNTRSALHKRLPSKLKNVKTEAEGLLATISI